MKTRGFTLIEIMVVVSIIAIISSIGIFSYNEASQKSRNGNRQADLKMMQTAIELYKQKNGRYPAGCNTPGSWSGQIGTSYACPGGSGQYIVGLAPQYIRFLPQEKHLNGVDSGYVYTTNTDGTVYKIMALNTVEAETVTPQSPLSRCGDTDNGDTDCSMVPASPSDGRDDQYNLTGNTPNQCFGEITNDYSLVGGFADGTGAKAREYYSDIIRCK
jgi:prepilin-type N-terminal cleavage/methylation domain-containing protein